MHITRASLAEDPLPTVIDAVACPMRPRFVAAYYLRASQISILCTNVDRGLPLCRSGRQGHRSPAKVEKVEGPTTMLKSQRVAKLHARRFAWLRVTRLEVGLCPPPPGGGSRVLKTQSHALGGESKERGRIVGPLGNIRNPKGVGTLQSVEDLLSGVWCAHPSLDSIVMPIVSHGGGDHRVAKRHAEETCRGYVGP